MNSDVFQTRPTFSEEVEGFIDLLTDAGMIIEDEAVEKLDNLMLVLDEKVWNELFLSFDN